MTRKYHLLERGRDIKNHSAKKGCDIKNHLARRGRVIKKRSVKRVVASMVIRRKRGVTSSQSTRKDRDIGKSVGE